MEVLKISEAFKKITLDLTVISGRVDEAVKNIESALSWEKDETVKTALKEIAHSLESTYEKANDLITYSDGCGKEVEKASSKQIGFF